VCAALPLPLINLLCVIKLTINEFEYTAVRPPTEDTVACLRIYVHSELTAVVCGFVVYAYIIIQFVLQLIDI